MDRIVKHYKGCTYDLRDGVRVFRRLTFSTEFHLDKKRCREKSELPVVNSFSLLGSGRMTKPEPVIATSDAIRFPRLYFAIKWTIIVSLTCLAVLAAAFWTLVLGQFSASGFRANPVAGASENLPITTECAWPLDANDHDAKAVCRMFYNLTPEQRAQVLAKRSGK